MTNDSPFQEGNVLISLRADSSQKVSFALQQNGFPVVRDVIIKNDGDFSLENARLDVSALPQFFKPFSCSLPDIHERASYSLDTLDLTIEHGQLARLVESEKGMLTIRLAHGEKILAESLHPVEVLARNQWGGLTDYPESIAAFVQPNDPAVDSLLGQASQLLRAGAPNQAFTGYDGTKASVWRQLAALWNTLYAQGIGYVLPPAGFEDRGQKVRSPSQVIEAKLGTCLDTSLLFAACMEQCGLHPLLIFTKGHAFVGCWLIDDMFAAMLTDDVTALRKRVGLKELLVFETTLLNLSENPVSFQDACQRGEHNLREEASADFLCALDLCRARAQHITPLAMANADAANSGQSTIRTVKSAERALTLDVPLDILDDEAVSPTTKHEPPATPVGRLELWQRKLLDLSLRNSLLNFRAAKRFVEIVTRDPGQLEDMLSDGERFRLDAGLPRVASQLLEASAKGPEQQQALLQELAADLLTKKTLLAPLEAKDLEGRLINLYRTSRAALEEGGANTLYLVMGFLTWRARGRSAPVKAPLLLLPVRLERGSVRSGFTLIQGDDEPRFNLTLLEMLRKDYGLTSLDSFATELPTDGHGLDVSGIWRTVQTAIKDIPGWEVSPTVALGSFSFAKYLMWKDLCDQAHLLRQNHVVEHLLARPGAYPDDPPFVTAKSLDTTLLPQDIHCPLLADSSQMAAIFSAAKGKDFVLIGPPGTGKSQTIANMIAQCLSEKKTVLFVAEKTAALNVVYRRLKKIGLGDFCLEMHSNKANKATVLAQLAAATDRHSTREQSEWAQLATRLCRTRDTLNAYVRNLHQTYRNGLTPFIAMGTIVGSAHMPEIPLQWEGPEVHDRQAYADLFVQADKLKVHAEQALRHASTALRVIEQDDWSPLWQKKLIDAVSQALKDALTLENNEAAATSALGIPPIQGSMQHMSNWKTLTDMLPTIGGINCTWILDHQATSIVLAVRDAVAALQDYQAAEAQLTAECRQQYTVLLEIAEKLQNYGNAALQHAQSPLRFVNNNQWTPQWEYEVVEALQLAQQGAEAIERSGADLARLLGLGDLGNDAHTLAQWVVMARALPEAWNHRWNWVLATDADRTLAALREALSLLDEYNTTFADLSAPYTEEVFAIDLAELQKQWQESKTAWWPKNTQLIKRVKKALGSVCKAQEPDYENDLPVLLSLVPLRKKLEQTETLATQTQGVWAVFDTDTTELSGALNFADTLRGALVALRISPVEFTSLNQALQNLLGPANSLLGPTGSARHILAEWAATTTDYTERVARIRGLLQAPTSFANASPHQNNALFASLLALQQHFRGWCGWRQLCNTAEKFGLRGMVVSLHQGILLPKQCVTALHQAGGEYVLDQGERKAALLALSTTPDSDALLLTQLRALRERIAQCASLSSQTNGMWVGYATQLAAVHRVLDFADALAPCLAQLAHRPEAVSALHAGLRSLLDTANTAQQGNAVAWVALANWAAAMQACSESHKRLTELIGKPDLFLDKTLPDFMAFCRELLALGDNINEWCAWLRACREAAQHGLQPLVSALYDGLIEPNECSQTLRVNYARWWIMCVVESLDTLKTFVLSEHEHTLHTFQELDEKLRDLCAEQIAATLRAHPLFAEGAANEWHVLQRELQKKKRHMPLRKLVSSLPTLLPRLTPCFLMSPLSIAQYLQAGQAQFDVIIFDEASQIPVWDAIGAMTRGKRVIVVGDPKQLPPTNFFQRADEEDVDEATDIDGDMESILDECLSTGLPSLPLRWHYRSRHEKLIVFANHRYYGGKLVTFPSACTEDTSITLHTVDGVYERGASRTNPIEARALVADVVALLRSPECRECGWSVGIVTFNTQQQQLIEDLLDAARRGDPSLEPFFAADREEPVIVKNLENIQGDERDIMYFSICFAPDQAGHLSMNFGALNKDGGERRLNVAITRARVGLRVFCSMRAEQISLQQTRAQGVRDLRLFLEFTEKGIQALAGATQHSTGEFESPFEEAVAQALEANGWEVHPQVGVSAFRVDLGIVDPDAPGAYLAGVECDGATYHSSATARDRDRLRESVLRGLGWEIVRIWSTDWWMQRNAALERLNNELKSLLVAKRQERERQEALRHEQVVRKAPASNIEKNMRTDPQVEQHAEKISVTSPQLFSETLQTDSSKKSASDALLLPAAMLHTPEHEEGEMDSARIESIIRAIVPTQSPIHANALAREVARQLGFKRTGNRIQAAVERIAHGLYTHSTEDVGIFIWDTGQSPETCDCFCPRQADGPCVVDEIAMPILVCLARSIQAQDGEDPVVLMARKLGLKRLREATRPRLKKAWDLR